MYHNVKMISFIRWYQNYIQSESLRSVSLGLFSEVSTVVKTLFDCSYFTDAFGWERTCAPVRE